MNRMTRPTFLWLRAAACHTLALGALLGLSACSSVPPDGISAVTPFDIQRYEGVWYEMARLDHSFERGLTDVSARYQVQADGSVQVINRGFDAQRQDWKEAVGRAKFTGPSDRGSLKVSFFGPFYAGYHVVALDMQAYRWALVLGPNRDYAWILARDKQLPDAVRASLLAQAQTLGIAVDQLIWVPQTREQHPLPSRP
jgi:apolipoprotein D and lipocalin family protein